MRGARFRSLDGAQRYRGNRGNRGNGLSVERRPAANLYVLPGDCGSRRREQKAYKRGDLCGLNESANRRQFRRDAGAIRVVEHRRCRGCGRNYVDRYTAWRHFCRPTFRERDECGFGRGVLPAPGHARRHATADKHHVSRATRRHFRQQRITQTRRGIYMQAPHQLTTRMIERADATHAQHTRGVHERINVAQRFRRVLQRETVGQVNLNGCERCMRKGRRSNVECGHAPAAREQGARDGVADARACARDNRVRRNVLITQT